MKFKVSFKSGNDRRFFRKASLKTDATLVWWTDDEKEAALVSCDDPVVATLVKGHWARITLVGVNA